VGDAGDRDLGLDTLFECGDHSRFVLAGNKSSQLHYFGMTRPFWKELDWAPDCRIGSLGLALNSRPLLEQGGIAVADGSRYLPRDPAQHPPVTKVLAVSAPADAAIMVTNVLAGYEVFQMQQATADTVEVPAAITNDFSALYRPPRTPSQSVQWTFKILSSNPSALDIVSVMNPGKERRGDVPLSRSNPGHYRGGCH
jgi:hypothetical protein